MPHPTLSLVFTLATATLTAQEFPKDIFGEGRSYAAAIQFGKDPSEKVDSENESFRQVRAYLAEDLERMGLGPKLIYLKAPKGVGGLAGQLKKDTVRCLLQFTFYNYPKKGGVRADYSSGILEIVEVDAEGKKSAKSVRYTIGEKGVPYDALLAELKRLVNGE